MSALINALRLCGGFCLLLFWTSAAMAAPASALVAVAANFSACAEALAEDFEARSGHDIALSIGATGALSARALQGAPYDALLAADAARPALLYEKGLGAPGASPFTYAMGRLALYGDFDPEAGAAALKADFHALSIANPKTAPYGAAALQVLGALNPAPKGQIAHARNVGGALAAVISGGAPLGVVALGDARRAAAAYGGAVWPIPEGLHEPLRQDALLLVNGAENAAAIEFLAYLRGDAARALILAHGYDAPQ